MKKKIQQHYIQNPKSKDQCKQKREQQHRKQHRVVECENEKYREILHKMSLADKIALCAGADFWRSKGFLQYGIPSVTVCDGPHGLRYQKADEDMLGIHQSMPATCFPSASLTGCSWDEELLQEIGEAIGEEAASYGVSAVLGPGLNIKRNPLCGRNFEYFSEDPCLSGKLAASWVRGAQSTGASACLKHFAGNSQEYKRFSSNDEIDERTLREIYLTGFETAVKESHPGMVMCAYNKLNGTYCSDNKGLLTGILRKEWGFNGVVVTDWGAMHDRVKGFRAGCDWSMPGGRRVYQKERVLQAVKQGKLKEKDIDKCAERMLRFVMGGHKRWPSLQERLERRKLFEQHELLARKAARRSIVLLKNEDILPVRGMEDMVLIGDMAKHPHYQGAGSSHIQPTFLTSLTQALPGCRYLQGCDELGNTTEKQLDRAARAAAKSSVAVVVAGLTDRYESEGFDREHMQMPEGHNRLIERVVAANPNTVVVLCCGSPVEIPWFDKVKGVLYAGLSGQAGALALADLLLGKASPEGKLAETWPIHYEDVPCAPFYGAPFKNAEYRESVYVGYRYYDSAKVPVRFPFGYGLSYTTFSYEGLSVQENEVSCKIRNTGAFPGAEIVQLYIAPVTKGIFRPSRELRRFAKVRLKPGEAKKVKFTLDERCFAIWDQGFVVPQGEYEIEIGSSVEDIRLRERIHRRGEAVEVPKWQEGSWYENLQGMPKVEEWEKLLGRKSAGQQAPTKGSFTMENTILEMAEHSLPLKLISKVMKIAVRKMSGGSKDETDPQNRMAYSCSADCAIFGIVQTGVGFFSEKRGKALVDIANGHILRGILGML